MRWKLLFFSILRNSQLKKWFDIHKKKSEPGRQAMNWKASRQQHQEVNDKPLRHIFYFLCPTLGNDSSH